MYESFFGFQRAPFELVPDPDFLFLGESHESALANLVLGIESGRGIIAIAGPVGSGKTTVLRALMRRLGRQQSISFLSQPEFDTVDLLRSILDGFGVTSHGLDKIELRRRTHDYLSARSKPGVLIVDEAHLLSEDSLEQIRLLSNLEEDDRKLLQIILAGQPELKAVLLSPRLRPLTQRIEVYYEIAALTGEETAAYIDRRVRIAGNPAALRFEPKAIDRIHHLSGGIPRLINILADRSLITAYVDETTTITEKIVWDAFQDLGEVTHSVMPGLDGRSGPATPPRPPADRRRETPAPQRAERAPVGEPRRVGEGVDRWFSVGGIAAVVLLAILSFRSEVLPGSGLPGLGGRAAVPPPNVQTRLDEAGVPAAVAVVGESVVARESPRTRDGIRSSGRHAIHVASFRDLEKARSFARTLREQTEEPTRISPTEVETGLWYRVLLGEYESKTVAQERIRVLRQVHDFTYMRPIRLIHPEEEDRRAATSP